MPPAPPAPAIGSLGVPAPAAPSPAAAAPAIGTLGAAPAAAPAIGTLGGPAPSGALAPAPAIGSIAPTPSQRLAAGWDSDLPAAPPYEPPTAKIPPAPDIPGKWKPEYTKDRKKYVVPGLDGLRKTESFTRATTHAKVLDDATNLTDWRLRGTVLGLARNPELLDGLDLDGAQHISELDWGSKMALSGVVNKAMRRVGGSDGSDFGDKLHGYLEVVLAGYLTLDQVPAEMRPYLEVIFASMRQHGFQFVQNMMERTVFIPATGLVGTFDFLALSPDGELLIGDLKTSSSIQFSWLAIGVQLAQYANAEMMLSWDGSHWEVMPPVSKVMGLVISVPKDEPVPTARPFVVDLNLGTEMMELATRVQGIHETALRAAANTDLLQDGDELIAWAAGDPLTLTELRSPQVEAA